MDWQCQAVALSHKKKTAGRPPDWPEETESNAEWERLASNEVIWEEMINGSGNVQEIDAEKRNEGTLNAGKTSEEITPDAGVTDPSDKMIKSVHGERSEMTTGQQKMFIQWLQATIYKQVNSLE